MRSSRGRRAADVDSCWGLSGFSVSGLKAAFRPSVSNFGLKSFGWIFAWDFMLLPLGGRLVWV